MPTRTRGWIVQTCHTDRFNYERHLSTCPAKGLIFHVPCPHMPCRDEPHYQLVAEVHPVLFGSMYWSKSLLTWKCLLLPITGFSGLYPGSVLFLFWEEGQVGCVPCAFRMSSSSSLPSIHPVLGPNSSLIFLAR